jgi:uncharacterized protein (DUF1015 family)
MADVRPFRALRYAPELDLADAICPPFDVISSEQQHVLHERSPYNAIHIELADNTDGHRYRRAAETLTRWREEGALRQDDDSAFYLYDQRFERDGRVNTRRSIFARLRLEPWEKGVVLPHEQTFGGPKEDRLRLLRAIEVNTSPVFLIYRDRDQQIHALLERVANGSSVAEVNAGDGQHHTLRRIGDPADMTALTRVFSAETLYVADGHHRYETALGYRDERRAAASEWSGDELENFALVALASAGEPGLLVLPIHRVTAGGGSLPETMGRLKKLFKVEPVSPAETLAGRLAERGETGPAFGLVSAESGEAYLLSISDGKAIDSLLPQERSPVWRTLDYAIANYAVLRHGLGLTESQMSDYDTIWFTEDADEAIRDVHQGRARYALLMNSVSVSGVLDVADAGDRMPQKSTFFYPKMPTGLVFNPLD